MYTEEISFELVLPKHRKSLVSAIQGSFPGGETMARVLGISKEEYLPFTIQVVDKAIADRKSFVAVSSLGEVAAFVINEDFFCAPLYSTMRLSPKFLPLFRLLERLDDAYSEQPIQKEGEIFHLYMLGTLPAFSNRGLGKQLLKGALGFAKELGFKKAIAEATGTHSQKLCADLGFRTVASLCYGSFTFLGGFPFAEIKTPDSCRLVEYNLTST